MGVADSVPHLSLQRSVLGADGGHGEHHAFAERLVLHSPVWFTASGTEVEQCEWRHHGNDVSHRSVPADDRDSQHELSFCLVLADPRG